MDAIPSAKVPTSTRFQYFLQNIETDHMSHEILKIHKYQIIPFNSFI